MMRKYLMAALFAGLSLASTTAFGVQTTFTSTDVPKAIPDNNPTGITSIVNVTGIGTVSDVNVIFSSLTHTSVPDLHIELRSPTGLQIPLLLAFTEGGLLTGTGTPDNFINTVFDDQAPTSLRDGTSPYTGSFNVDGGGVGNDPLTHFNGLNATGTWTLFISDRAIGDIGTLNSWALQITGDAVGVPEPASLLILGASIAGLSGLRRRRVVQG